MKALIIAAHPDDEVLGCGGLIAKGTRAGHEFHVLILTDGADTRYPRKMRGVLRRNAAAAGRILGSKSVVFGGLPNQKLDAIPLLRVVGTVERHIAKLRPDTVFTQSQGDLNEDHRVAYQAALTATRPIPGQCVRRLYTYFVASSTEWNQLPGSTAFVPNVFVDIARQLPKKLAAMGCYPSECRPYPHPRSLEALRAYAHYWGLASGREFAEPFFLVRDLSGPA